MCWVCVFHQTFCFSSEMGQVRQTRVHRLHTPDRLPADVAAELRSRPSLVPLPVPREDGLHYLGYDVAKRQLAKVDHDLT